jgi:hypothetical protein
MTSREIDFIIVVAELDHLSRFISFFMSWMKEEIL